MRTGGPSGAFGYRPDIDGLRAIAVMSVILFHVRPSLLPGGFLGVDVFLVISGYLISALLLQEVRATGRIDLVDFYRRRAQRILPALFFVIANVVVFGWLLMTPEDFVSLLESGVAAAASFSNIYFLLSHDFGYFSPGTDYLPLLHTWSLGVEEQFYLVWPVLLLGMVTLIRGKNARFASVFALLVISLVTAEWSLSEHQQFAYYMLPTRAWELMAGSLAALLVSSGVSLRGWWAQLAGLLGIVLIGGSVILVDEGSGVPGVAALPCVLGAILVVLSSPATILARVMSTRVMVGIGLVSYSAYLWHWPILAFLRYADFRIGLWLAILVVVTTFLLAGVSYFLVERPLRRIALPRKKVFARFFLAPTLVLVLLSLSISVLVKVRHPAIYRWDVYTAIDGAARAPTSFEYNCQFRKFSKTNFSDDRCVYPIGSVPRVLMIGDSNAAHYLGVFRVFSDKYGFAFRNATQSACPPVFGDVRIDWMSRKYAADCSLYRQFLPEVVKDYDVVVVGGSWFNYDRAGADEFRLMLEETVHAITKEGPRVILLAQAPIFPGYSQSCARRKVRMPFIECMDYAKTNFRYDVNEVLRNLARDDDKVHFFDIRDALCSGSGCVPTIAEKPAYYNAGHMSMVGSQLVGEKMLNDFEQLVHPLVALLAPGRASQGKGVVTVPPPGQASGPQ